MDDRGGGGRARWGDRGVGVGHLWAPGEEASPGGRSGEVLPPAWADQQEDNVLPGAPFSKQGQRYDGSALRLLLSICARRELEWQNTSQRN